MAVNISRLLAKAKVVYDDIHTQIIDSDEIGINITLYYPATWAECINCEHSDWGNTYKTGGPAPFNLGGCPMCGGACNYQVEESEEIKLRVYQSDATGFTKKNLKKIGISVDVPDGELLTIGKVVDIPKIQAAAYAVFYSDNIADIGQFRYKVSSEITPHGFGKGKFFFCKWSRI
jgi:hypothetical protein